jgi:hypothetical protein
MSADIIFSPHRSNLSNDIYFRSDIDSFISVLPLTARESIPPITILRALGGKQPIEPVCHQCVEGSRLTSAFPSCIVFLSDG